jgi:hypothetical protein
VESNWVHTALWPPVGLLCQPRVIMLVENLVKWWLAGETKELRENLPQWRFVCHKPHMLCPVVNPGCRGGKPVTNRLSYGTAFFKPCPQLENFASLCTGNVGQKRHLLVVYVPYMTNYFSELNIILIKVIFLHIIFMKYYLFRKYATFTLPCKRTIMGKFNMAFLVTD